MIKDTQRKSGLNKKEKLLLLKDMIIADQELIDLMNEEESIGYFDCLEIFIQTSDKTIMEASLATRYLIVEKVKERVE